MENKKNSLLNDFKKEYKNAKKIYNRILEFIEEYYVCMHHSKGRDGWGWLVIKKLVHHIVTIMLCPTEGF